MTIRYDSRRVRLARRTCSSLLLAEHYGECYSCQRTATASSRPWPRSTASTDFTFGHPEAPVAEVDASSYSVVRDMNKCIRCRRCVRTCIDLQEVGVLEANRSDQSRDHDVRRPSAGLVVCINCGQCINRCPTGALYAKDETDAVWAAIDDPDQARRHQTAPGAASAMGECFGLEAGTARPSR